MLDYLPTVRYVRHNAIMAHMSEPIRIASQVAAGGGVAATTTDNDQLTCKTPKSAAAHGEIRRAPRWGTTCRLIKRSPMYLYQATWGEVMVTLRVRRWLLLHTCHFHSNQMLRRSRRPGRVGMDPIQPLDACGGFLYVNANNAKNVASNTVGRRWL